MTELRGTDAPPAGRTAVGRFTTVAICVLAGFMITVAAIAARGSDLRSDRNASLRDLIGTQARRNEVLRVEAEGLRAEVDQLSRSQAGGEALAEQQLASGLAASTEAVTGPGLRVILSDAPSDVKPAGVDDDALVVHQQDIQAVVNALWASGAEAITIQGQRVIATTGIKCVGNSVVLHGVPYAPPYVVEAIGDADQLLAGLSDSRPVQIYRQYVEAYGLGYSEERLEGIDMPAFQGSLGITVAQPGR